MTLITAAALTLAACESASLAPEVRIAPATAPSDAARYDALLQAMNSGDEATPEQRRAVLRLAEALGRTTFGHADGSAPAPALSPAAQAALLELAASPSGAEMRRALERLAADPTKDPTR
jgi:hypothetical protein